MSLGGRGEVLYVNINGSGHSSHFGRRDVATIGTNER